MWLTECLLPWCQQIIFSPVSYSGPTDYQRISKITAGIWANNTIITALLIKGQKQKESTIYTMKFNTVSRVPGCRIFLCTELELFS